MRCEQEVGSGRDVYRVPLPAVVTVKEGINLPRYPSVPAKLRARRKPVDRRAAGAARAAARDGAAGGAGGPRASRPRCSARGRRAAPAVVELFQRLGVA